MIAAKQTAYLMTRAIPSCILLVLINVLLILVLPPAQATMDAYHLSGFEYRIISFALSIPSFLVWVTAFIGYAKLFSYAFSIKDTPEGRHFLRLARGGLWLAWSLPLSKIFTTILSAIGNEWPSVHAGSIIIGNYISLALSLIAFIFIGSAARGLISVHKLSLSTKATNSIISAFIIAGVSYCYLVFAHFDTGSLTNADNGYYLPIWIMLLTIIIPYLYIWFIGMLAACDLALLGAKVRGHLYKRALAYLVAGLVIVIIGSISIQYISSVQPRTGYLQLNMKLAATLSFRVIQGIGFGLMTVGAIKLKKIEEV